MHETVDRPRPWQADAASQDEKNRDRRKAKKVMRCTMEAAPNYETHSFRYTPDLAAAMRVPPMNDPYLASRRPTLSRQLIASGYPFEDEYGYSRAVRVGDQVFVSGTTARPPHLDGDAHAQAQARAALELVADALTQAGAGLRHVVRTVVYVVDMADAPLVARAHLEAFGRGRPASTLVQVSALTPATARVEVEATAVIAD